MGRWGFSPLFHRNSGASRQLQFVGSGRDPSLVSYKSLFASVPLKHTVTDDQGDRHRNSTGTRLRVVGAREAILCVIVSRGWHPPHSSSTVAKPTSAPPYICTHPCHYDVLGGSVVELHRTSRASGRIPAGVAVAVSTDHPPIQSGELLWLKSGS